MAERYRLHFTLYRPATGDAAIPDVIHPYLVLSSPWLLPGTGVATVLTLNSDAPAPDRAAFISEKGGPREALALAVEAILALPTNKGLQSLPKDLSRPEAL
jgi:hypothetical protein